jgi:PAS domain S-box-containing protein
MADELGLLVDAVVDYAIFLLSPEGIIRSWNVGAERTMGYQANEVIGKHFSIFYPAEDIERRKPDKELEVAASEGRIEDEGWRVRKGGSLFWVNTVITALRNPDGSVRGFAKVTRDLSKQRQAEEELRQSEEMFRLLVESVKDYAIFLIDAQGYVTTWNEGARRIKQYEPADIIGKHFSVFYGSDDVIEGKPQRVLDIAAAWGSVEDEGWRVRKDGSRFWANVVITAVYDSSRTLRGFTKVTRDVTDRKRAEELQEALLEQREARFQAEEERRRAEATTRVAQEANRAKDQFLMTLSHELRTPMTAILGWARLLPTLPPNDPAVRDGILAIGRSAQLQTHLIDDVLDVSRIVSGKMHLSVENVDVERIVRNAVESVRTSADAKSIAIRLDLDPALGRIVADPTRVQQIIWNLLTNAIKFSPHGGVIEIRARRDAGTVRIDVHDQGQGIPHDFLPHVFEPFRQAEDATTRRHGGLGLGLSIVRYITEAHGGTITADSAGEGHGATFSLTLPVGTMPPQTAETVDVEEVAPTAVPVNGRLRGMDILLVDDDREGRQLVKAVLRQAGANVTAVDSAELGLAELGKRRPALIITDIAMPSMDGFQFAREVRNHPDYANLKMLAFSAFPTAKVESEHAEFDGYLAKPIDPAMLVDEVAKVGERRN